MLRTGIDIVHIPKMQRLLADDKFIERVFHGDERKPFTAEHLAGIFAAKEAFFKALGRNPVWLSLHVKGKIPVINYSPELGPIKNTSISISHDNEYAIAHVLVEL